MTLRTEEPIHLTLCRETDRKRRDSRERSGDPAGAIPAYENRERFMELLMPVKTQLYNFIRKAANFSPDADDVFQDTLLKGFRYFHSYDQDRSFKTWIFTVAHNQLKDMFRARRLLVPLEDTGDIPVEVTGAEQEAQEIYAVASGLKPKHREVFFLYYYNEFSVVEIAGITGLSRPNVKFILHQARKNIKKTMEVSK